MRFYVSIHQVHDDESVTARTWQVRESLAAALAVSLGQPQLSAIVDQEHMIKAKELASELPIIDGKRL